MNQRAIESGARALCSEMTDDWSQGKAYWRSVAQSVIGAIEAAGYAVVPREPTQAMTQAAMDALDSPFYADLERVYRAMIAAALETTNASD